MEVPDPLVYLGLLGIIAIAGVGVWTKLREIIPFAYPNARIRAKEGHLIDEDKYRELADSRSLEEVTSILEESDYNIPEEINSKTLENTLDKELIQTYQTLSNILPKNVRPIFEHLKREWDIKNLIVILKAKESGTDPQPYLTEVGELTDLFEDIISSEEPSEPLKDTRYYQAVRDYQVEEDKKVSELETELYEDYYNELKEKLEDNKDLKEYFGKQIDLKNISFILRGKVSNMDKERIQNSVIGGGTLNQQTLDKMIQAENIDTAISVLEGTEYFESISDITGQGLEKAETIERSLMNYNVKMGRDISIQQPIGLGPTIGYISRKKAEIKNLKAIITGVKNNLPSDKIKKFLVGMEAE